MKFVISIIFLIISECVMGQTSDTKTMALPDGSSITNSIGSLPPFEQKFRVLTRQEINRINELAKKGDVFVKFYYPTISRPDLKDFDRAFRAWQTSTGKKLSNQEVIQIIGSYLGNELVRKLNMEWVEVTDKYGTDYSIRGKNADVEITSFPYSTVSKRIEHHQYDFIYNTFHTIAQMKKDGGISSGNND
ncbi:DUF3806 domain-containing protein [Undibacterium sp. Di26W]|uniref:DUF3806 domain-containing protein n=1 Tax=Undibacterium sp. Di26W TaxID=3413035 RepID=UPI003BF08798